MAQSNQKPDGYLMEAANGMLVRVPADKLESWLKGQQEIRDGTYKPNEQLTEQIVSKVFSSKK